MEWVLSYTVIMILFLQWESAMHVMTWDHVYEAALFLFSFALFYDSCCCLCIDFLFYLDYLHTEAQQISATLILCIIFQQYLELLLVLCFL